VKTEPKQEEKPAQGGSEAEAKPKPKPRKIAKEVKAG
jgi:hypothetical protein